MSCQAITQKGTQCSRNSMDESDYCWQHDRIYCSVPINKFDKPQIKQKQTDVNQEAEIKKLKKENKILQDKNKELEDKNKELENENDELEIEVQELRRQLRFLQRQKSKVKTKLFTEKFLVEVSD